jgi:hypothetical protein
MRNNETIMLRVPKSLDELIRNIQRSYVSEYGENISLTEAARLLVVQHKNRGKTRVWGRDYL